MVRQRNTRIPAAPAPAELAEKITEFVEARQQSGLAGQKLKARRDEWTELLADATERVVSAEADRDAIIAGRDNAAKDEADDVGLSITVVEAARSDLIETAKAVRSDDAKVFIAIVNGEEWIVETKAAPASLEVPEESLPELAGWLADEWPQMLDVVMPRRPALTKLKELVKFAAKYKRPLPHVNLESRDVSVTIREPQPKDKPTAEAPSAADEA